LVRFSFVEEQQSWKVGDSKNNDLQQDSNMMAMDMLDVLIPFLANGIRPVCMRISILHARK
jgi:hypothetical protein